MENKTRRIVFAALFAALACVATMVIKIPSPLNGYMNLGDCVVLLSGWLLGPLYGFLAAGIGSALADVFSGYAFYLPATFVIKGVMALTAYFLYHTMKKGKSDFLPTVVSGIAAEIIMIAGYFVFEGFMYGFAESLVNIPANAVQGAAGIIIGAMLVKVFRKSKINFR